MHLILLSKVFCMFISNNGHTRKQMVDLRRDGDNIILLKLLGLLCKSLTPAPFLKYPVCLSGFQIAYKICCNGIILSFLCQGNGRTPIHL